MRTTIHLPDDLLAQAKQAAAASRRTLTQVIEEALREALGRRQRRGRTEAPRLPVFGEGGLLPGVDLDDSAALLDAMDATGAAPRR
ncbi:MAG: DUF2191 domain-containing protein [Acidobacteria bacterium]|nr:MAG: DUF2191 domain-containing protein [Acidobacteriota bacterium]